MAEIEISREGRAEWGETVFLQKPVVEAKLPLFRGSRIPWAQRPRKSKVKVNWGRVDAFKIELNLAGPVEPGKELGPLLPALVQ